MCEIYQPEEDSYLMSEIIEDKIPGMITKNSNLKFLEVGSGSGLNLQTALKSGLKKKDIFSLDINPDAVKKCMDLGFNCIKSNLFEKIPKQEFDLIIFNPPYLPEEELEPENSRIATTGGKKGSEIIEEFLKQSKNFLSKKGKIFIITSSLSNKINFKSHHYESKLLKSKKLFFEELFIWELTPKD